MQKRPEARPLYTHYCTDHTFLGGSAQFYCKAGFPHAELFGYTMYHKNEASDESVADHRNVACFVYALVLEETKFVPKKLF